MITCPICDYHYSENRVSCPTCGAVPINAPNPYVIDRQYGWGGFSKQLVLAHGAERARQLPQSPRVFQTVD